METTVPKSDDGNLERIFRKTISSDDKIFYMYFLLILNLTRMKRFFIFQNLKLINVNCQLLNYYIRIY